MSRSFSVVNAFAFFLSVMVALCLMCSYATCETGKDESSTKDDVSHWLAELKKRKPVKPVVASGETGGGPDVSAAFEPVSGPKASALEKGKEKKTILDGEPSKITVDFYKVDIHNVFRLLGEVSGKNIVVDEGVGGTLTLALRDVPWTFVLDVIKNLKGLASIERENTLMIFPAGKTLTWQGDLGAANLDVSIEPEIVEVEKEPEITPVPVVSPLTGEIIIEKRSKSKTPFKDRLAAEELVKKAGESEKTGNFLMAYEYIKKAVKLWPDNFDLNKKMASMALQQEDELTAYNYGRKAFYLEPSDNEAAGIVAVALARMNKLDEAKVFFEKAMESDEISRDIMWNYAVFSFSNGDYRQTMRIIDKIEKVYDLTPDVIMLKAQSLEYLDRRAQAVQEYKIILNAGGDVPADMVQFAQSRVAALEMGTTD